MSATAAPPGQSRRSRRPSPLRRRDFALVWAGGLVSDTGDWLLMIGLPIHVFAVTGSTLATSVLLVVELVPGLLLGSFAGVLVDRWDRRRTMVVTNLVQAALLLPLVVATSEDRLWLVYAVAGIESTLARLFNPAKLALVPSLVDPEDLLAANSLMGVNDNLARLVGSPLGGVCVAAFGLPGVVVVDAASFALAAALVAAARPAGRPRTDPDTDAERGPSGGTGARDGAGTGTSGGFTREWLDGLAVVRRSPPLRALAVVMALGQLAQGIFVVLIVVFVVRELGGSGTEIGLLRGMQAVGAIAGGVVIGGLGGRFDPRRLTAPALVAFGVVSLVTWNAPAVTTALAVYLALFVVVGVPAVAAVSGLTTLVQQHTDPAYLGRVLATLEAGGGALQVVGLLVAGTLADDLGVVTVLNVEATVWMVAGVVAHVALHDGRRRRTGRRRLVGERTHLLDDA